MTEHDHYTEAEIWARSGCTFDPPCTEDGCRHEMAVLARAQVHATLALADAMAATHSHQPPVTVSVPVPGGILRETR
jgi:hypothetical protein